MNFKVDAKLINTRRVIINTQTQLALLRARNHLNSAGVPQYPQLCAVAQTR